MLQNPYKKTEHLYTSVVQVFFYVLYVAGGTCGE
jgi:hypothetical protein